MSDGRSPEHRLAVYGSLGPGRVNHHHLSDLGGTWSNGRVRGRLVEAGWGADLGFPGMHLDEAGDLIDVQLLESPDLPHHWDRLDAFEGPGYRRVATTVDTGDGPVGAYIFVLALH